MTQRVLSTVKAATHVAGQGIRDVGRSRLSRLAAIFFVSGVAGLVYELLWLRILALTFGVTNYAVSTVLASFMAGLALGSIVAGRYADRLKHPLRTYATLEVLIGVTGVLTLVAFAGLQELYRGAHPYLSQSPMLLTAGRFVLSFLILMVPTSLMGATLPVFLRSSLVRDSHAGTHLSLIYAVNTFGAIVGCLAAPFFIIGTIGIRNGVFLAAALNTLAAVLAWGVSVGEKGALGSRLSAQAGAGRAAVRSADAFTESGERRAESAYPATVRTLAFWVIGISGLLSLAYEVVWARLLSVCFDASVYSFAIMLAVYLFGLAAGSAAVKPLMGRRLPWPAVLAGVEFLIGITALFSLYWLSQFGWEAQDEEIRRPLLVSFIALFPPTFLMGTSFPIAAEIFTAGLSEVGRRVGTIYAVNVCGSILGSLIGGFVLLPQLGVEASLKLLVVGSALLGGVMFAGSPSIRREQRPWWALGAVALLALTLQSMPPLYDTLFARRFPGEKAVWRQEGIENTVTIADAPGQRVMYLNGHHQANDSKGMISYHSLIGHLPMVLHPNPRRALVIGLGGGATPGAVTQYPDAIVDCVELSPSVVAGARFFEHVNHALLKQPNLRMKVDDGRNHLLLTKEKYDVITADVIMPHHAGAGNLYSVDYYRMCRDALAPGGLMCQWIWQNSRFQYQMMMRSFLRAFPYVTVWKDGSLLIGSNQPIRLSRAAIAAKFANPTSRAALALVDLHNADEVLALYTGNREEALAYVGDGPIVSDDRPLIEYYRSTQEMTDVPSIGRIYGDIRRAFHSRPPVADGGG